MRGAAGGRHAAAAKPPLYSLRLYCFALDLGKVAYIWTLVFVYIDDVYRALLGIGRACDPNFGDGQMQGPEGGVS